MRRNLAVFLLMGFSLVGNGQLADCEDRMKCRIIAPSGMKMRSRPSLSAEVIVTVPYDTSLKACLASFGTMTYENIKGNWRRVYYKEYKGYMFDGFLEVIGIEKERQAIDSSIVPESSVKEKPIEKKVEKSIVTTPVSIFTTTASKFSFVTEVYNYCGDIRDIDPGLLWYGIYPEDEKGRSGNYHIKQVEIIVVKSKYNVGKNLEFDIITDNKERSIFLFGVNKPLELKKITIKDQGKLLRYRENRVFPGQQVVLTEGQNPIKLSAMGTVQSISPCPDLESYKLILSGDKYLSAIRQNLMEEIVYPGQCGMPEIYWYGDLTGDGVPEMILVSVYDERNYFNFFVSDPSKDNFLVRKQAEWIIDKCY